MSYIITVLKVATLVATVISAKFNIVFTVKARLQKKHKKFYFFPLLSQDLYLI